MISGPAHPAVMISMLRKGGAWNFRCVSAGSHLRRTHQLVVGKIELVQDRLPITTEFYFCQIWSSKPLTAPPTPRDPSPGGFTYSSALFVVGAPDCSLKSLSKLTLGAVPPLSTGPVTISEFGALLVEGQEWEQEQS